MTQPETASIEAEYEKVLETLVSEIEVKKIKKEYRKEVNQWKKDHPDWDNDGAFSKVSDFVGKSTFNGYKSNIPKFCTFMNMTPNEIIEKRKQDLKESSTDFEDKLGEFRKLLVTKHFPWETIRTILGQIGGLFSNNSVSLDMPKTFYNDKTESKYCQATREGAISIPPTNEEIRKVYDVADIETKAFILFTSQCGLNNIDIVNLTWKNLGVTDWDKEDREFIPICIMRNKTAFDRVYFLNPDIQYVLKAIWIKQGRPTGAEYIFYGREHDEDKGIYVDNPYVSFSENKVRDKIKVYADQVLSGNRLDEFTPRQLRQSYSNALTTIKINDIKRLLMGHKLANADSEYSSNLDDIMKAYREVFPKLTVNGWLYKEQAKELPEIKEKLEESKEDRALLRAKVDQLTKQVEDLSSIVNSLSITPNGIAIDGSKLAPDMRNRAETNLGIKQTIEDTEKAKEDKLKEFLADPKMREALKKWVTDQQ